VAVDPGATTSRPLRHLYMTTLMVFLALAGTPTTFENELTLVDDRYYALKRAHSYELWFAPGTDVTLRLRGAMALNTTFSGFASGTTLSSPAGGSGETTIRIPAGKRQLIRFHLGSDGTLGEYSLEVTPAPQEIQTQPPPKGSRAAAIARAEAGQKSFQLQAAVNLDGVRAAAEKRREELRERCGRAAPGTIFQADARNDRTVFTFCDETRVTRSATEAWSVEFSQSTQDFLDFTAVERANVDTARHNASVLKTGAADSQVTQALRALKNRITLFERTRRLPEAKYIALARAHQPKDR
jgi:hypothetical protein